MADTKYTFLPWIRKGISTILNYSETDLPAGPVASRVEFSAKANFAASTGGTLDSTHQMSMMGPEDIKGISESEIVRIDPQPYSKNLESNYLPVIEFYNEDFPWRFTPLAPHGANLEKLRPWFYLLVLKEDEFTLPAPPSNDRILTFTSTAISNVGTILPPADQVWAWAHVHVNSDLADSFGGDIDQMKAAIEADPSLAFSRMISPRRLQQDTKYHCFLIPTFETGRLSGINEPVEGVPYHQNSWDTSNFNAANAIFPYYYNWEFTTADSGDFETLANKIKPRPASTLETTVPFSIADIGIDVPSGTNQVMEFEGALQRPGFISPNFREEAANADFVENLSSYLNRGLIDGTNDDNLDPTLVASAHGKWIANESVFNENNYTEWYKDLNLDPRNRAVAGLGVSIVKEFQEEFMAEAWSQVESVQKANQQIREAKLIGKAGERIMHKHIVPRNMDLSSSTLTEAQKKSANTLLRLSRGQILENLGAAGTAKTLKETVDESALPNALLSGTFRKMARPGRAMSKSVSASMSGSVTDTIIYEAKEAGVLDGNGSESYPFYNSMSAVANEVNSDSFSTELTSIDTSTASDLSDFMSSASWNALKLDIDLQTATVKDAFNPDVQDVREELNPMKRIKDVLRDSIEIWNPELNGGDGGYESFEDLNQIKTYPELDFPLYKYLEKIAKHAILPNLQDIPENSVTLMEINSKFIDSLLMGANQEMAKELLWRKYPTDQKGSFFRMFWDKGDTDVQTEEEFYDSDDYTDIDPGLFIDELGNEWNNPDRLILVMTGELFDKFPGLQLFASKAVMGDENGETVLTHSTDVIMPQFKAKLGSDLFLVSFNLTVTEALGSGTGDDLGYYFVFQERMGELRFGLDEVVLEDQNDPIPEITAWNNMHWENDSLDYFIDVHTDPQNLLPALQLKWGESSSRMAQITKQRPIYFKIHATELL